MRQCVNLLASWEKMCTLHGISRATMYRYVKETELPTDRTPHGMSEIPPMKRANLQVKIRHDFQFLAYSPPNSIFSMYEKQYTPFNCIEAPARDAHQLCRSLLFQTAAT